MSFFEKLESDFEHRFGFVLTMGYDIDENSYHPSDNGKDGRGVQKVGTVRANWFRKNARAYGLVQVSPNGYAVSGANPGAHVDLGSTTAVELSALADAVSVNPEPELSYTELEPLDPSLQREHDASIDHEANRELYGDTQQED